MQLAKEKKFFTIILVFYWLSIFIATHIPVPGWTGKMGVSDKTMHFTAYMTLAILLWLSSSFGQKACWRGLKSRLLLSIVSLYAVMDEALQHFTRRSFDLSDMASNFGGIAAAFLLVTLLQSTHVTMILVSVSMLFLPAFVRSRLITQNSIFEAAAYMAGFAIVTIAWIKYLSLVYKLNFKKLKNIPIFFAGPAAIAAIVKIYAALTDKPFGITAFLSVFASIILILFYAGMITNKPCYSPPKTDK